MSIRSLWNTVKEALLDKLSHRLDISIECKEDHHEILIIREKRLLPNLLREETSIKVTVIDETLLSVKTDNYTAGNLSLKSVKQYKQRKDTNKIDYTMAVDRVAKILNRLEERENAYIQDVAKIREKRSEIEALGELPFSAHITPELDGFSFEYHQCRNRNIINRVMQLLVNDLWLPMKPVNTCTTQKFYNRTPYFEVWESNEKFGFKIYNRIDIATIKVILYIIAEEETDASKSQPSCQNLEPIRTTSVDNEAP